MNKIDKEKSPLLSIITVCFNAEHFILDTIESIKLACRELYPSEFIQLVIVDGLSKDKTVDKIKRAIAELPENLTVNFISEKDNGIYDAMNKGISLSNAKVIGFLNAGDLYLKDSIRLILNAFENKNIDFMFGNVLWSYKYKKFPDLVIPHKSSENFKLLKKGMTINHPTVFCKKELFYKYGFYDTRFRYVADWVWINKMIDGEFKNQNFLYLNEVLVIFDMSGVSNQFIYKRYKEIFSVYHFFLKEKKISSFKFFLYSLMNFKSMIFDFFILNFVPEMCKEKISYEKKIKEL